MSNPDPTEAVRRQTVIDINTSPGSRQALEAKHGQVWDPQEVARQFELGGFFAPVVLARRKADGARGTLLFQHEPRFYFGFVAD